MITLVKLGGSHITDKHVRSSFRQAEMARIAREIAASLQASPDLKLIIGHGSGSFGHFEAKQYDTMRGVSTLEQWRGFASVATVAAELNYLAAKELHSVGVPVFRVQPSASAQAKDGEIVQMSLEPVKQALEHQVVPLVYGDVAFDIVRGGTIISTETIFTYLAKNLPVREILLLGEVDGVYDSAQQVIPEITPDNFPVIQPMLGGSSGVDVTGGMLTKVEDMLALVMHQPEMTIRIFNGKTPGLLEAALRKQESPGTLIYAPGRTL
jgi:isopentenyl phosphate kinase